MNAKLKRTKTSVTPVLLKHGEVANLLGISEQHLSRLNAAGRIPAPLKLGKSTRWSRKELEEWITAGGPPKAEWEQLKENLQ
jgi:excisionase family DNA binding protein